ncbi:hypothetical protein CXG81DRAFT_16073 [Caulochytrium protostelioides]|uniref:DNA 3'-5' helicase n=1 Tax=Caulochytrium protostelioides TaxID=1555241 RepID=A0A4P9WX29_9FUNG|nr:DNA repair helicase rad25 [Caulochytrium protostelioides]RKO98322.1 hypothetical protein CXG81DRAFT_16073 [Caulochytrium protostelioides]|eukprot:RKO98322.1 hypothetical protein CXG81DRAFT_16073 [Caulochytrium protostelioides]
MVDPELNIQHQLVLPRTAALDTSLKDQLFGDDDGDIGEENVLQQHGPQVIHDEVTSLFEDRDDYTFLPLKAEHKSRPLYVCDDGRIILEAFAPNAARAEDFLITIAEPVSRPARIHEYKLTAYSLYAAVSVGMETATILDVMERFSKVTIPDRVVRFIKDCTLSYGKVKLVLKHNRYFIESNFPETLRVLLQDDTIRLAHLTAVESVEKRRIKAEERATKLGKTLPQQPVIASITSKSLLEAPDDKNNVRDRLDQAAEKSRLLDDDNDDDDESDFVQSFEIDKPMVEEVKKRCTELDFPLMEEYDFRNDSINPDLEIDLSPATSIRDYQEKCLSKMFGSGGGRARSGIIVLPTGAGKTLVGITAACTVKKSTLVLCTNALSVEQWAAEFLKWSSIKEGDIAKFTADNKTRFRGDSGIVVSTYTMISHSGKRSWETGQMLNWINSQEWGLLILDEVHVVPANVFRRVLTTVAAHTKMGLTATLVREDDKIEDLNFLIGPKLYEANWMELAGRGHIAKVEATEVWCPMTSSFYRTYLESKPAKRSLLCVMNPTKLQACQYLINQREAAGDKIIVFSDNVFALEHYAKLLNKPFIYGQTSHIERTRILKLFRQGHHMFRTILLSKVGDTSLDLPEATCLIQISSQFGSRRQEAQRMGRILRAKRRNEEGFRSRFFTLVSRDTQEVAFSAKRRRFLVDQGYEFHVIPQLTDLIPPNILPSLHYNSEAEQQELLEMVLQASDEAARDEILETRTDDMAGALFALQEEERRAGGQLSKSKARKVIQRYRNEQIRSSREASKAQASRRHALFRQWKRKG